MPIESSLVYNKETRELAVRSDYDAIYPYWLATDDPNNLVTVVAATRSPGYPMSFKPNGPFKAAYLGYAATHDHMTIEMTDGRDGYNYMGNANPVHLFTIASPDPGYPAILPEPITLQHRANINVNFTNLSGAVNNPIRFMMQGMAYETARVRTEALRNQIAGALDRQHFVRPHYMANDRAFCAVANGATGDFFYTMDDLGYFEIHKIAAVGYAGVVTATTYLTALQARGIQLIFKDPSSTQLSSGLALDIPFTMINTPGGRPYILPCRFMMAPRTQLQLRVTNASGVAAVLFITLIGRKISAPSVR